MDDKRLLEELAIATVNPDDYWYNDVQRALTGCGWSPAAGNMLNRITWC